MSASGAIQTLANDDNTLDKHINSIFNLNPSATPQLISIVRIPRVTEMVKETPNYKKYYVPKVVSIGPYHFGKPKLQLVEKLKPDFTVRLLKGSKEKLRNLYDKLGEQEMIKELRSFYEEDLASEFSDMEFTKMMVLDSCFILYYAKYIFGKKPEDCPELKRHEIAFVHQDLFLLENQIPYIVVTEVMNLMEEKLMNKFKEFIDGTILAPVKPKRTWLESVLNCFQNDGKPPVLRMDSTGFEELSPPDHLLNLLHQNLTKKVPKDNTPTTDSIVPTKFYTYNVNDLVDAGIDFGPSDSMSLAYIEFVQRRWWFSANLELPPITVNKSTKPMLLNLTSYEMLSRLNDAWVASYVCLLDSLIDHPDDVKLLRKAEVLENSLGSDKEVVKLFRELAIDLAPNNNAYLDAKTKILAHCKSWRNTVIYELKTEYLRSPWTILALLGALTGLFFGGVQAYYTRWSPKGTCDDLCMFLKINHHL
ncbi:UPF0481 protein At3g47200-like [Bidens hawaiensis]|uniref:UPF0481 protein At3g47200-like n=1 Tax=Bidens hawaiensis TaxID=980011 RepID=UPI0040497CE5